MAAAQLLTRVGFPVTGWSRGASTLEGLPSYAGQDQFGEFLAGTDLLVCLLPATDATKGILNTATLSQLPRGASLINAGRGSHMVTQDVVEPWTAASCTRPCSTCSNKSRYPKTPRCGPTPASSSRRIAPRSPTARNAPGTPRC